MRFTLNVDIDTEDAETLAGFQEVITGLVEASLGLAAINGVVSVPVYVTDTLIQKIDALAHEYNGYSASAGGLSERQRVVDAIHGLVVGTSAVVQPAASLPGVTKDAGGFVIEVNPQVTPLTDFADVALQGPAGVVLPTLMGV